MSLKILSISGAFPSRYSPNHGVFVKERIKAISRYLNHDVSVLAPVPYFPRIPAPRRWKQWAAVPRRETVEGLPTVRPRYLMLPKIGGYVQSESILSTSWKHVERLHRSEPFDLVDAHFSYPGGVVGFHIARRLGIPLVITGRGEATLRFPTLPILGKKIARAVRGASRLVALSEEIADSFARMGADPGRIEVIANGVDTDKFKTSSQAAARRALGLPPDRPLVISVGNFQERKGFHLLVDAMPEISKRIPNAMLLLVGGPPPHGTDYTCTVKESISRHAVHDAVRLTGPIPHNRLATWYSAADIFALMSSREGSPNVLLEARACGLPAIATSIGGVREELADTRLGLLLDERSAESAARLLIKSLTTTWDREWIRSSMSNRTWRHVALRVDDVFTDALNVPAGKRHVSATSA